MDETSRCGWWYWGTGRDTPGDARHGRMAPGAAPGQRCGQLARRAAGRPAKHLCVCGEQDLREAIWALCHRSGLTKDVPLIRTAAAADDGDSEGGELALDAIPSERADAWILTEVSDYLTILQDRLFSSGLHVLGGAPTDAHWMSYRKAYFGDDRISDAECANIIASCRRQDSDGGGGITMNVCFRRV